MQTIGNSLLHVAIDENGAQLAQLTTADGQFDYLAGLDQHLQLVFPATNAANLTTTLAWTVVDKGDARVSLTMIDTDDSRAKFPYHFELMVTYAIEGNQLSISHYLKNNSEQAMPYLLGLNLPVASGFTPRQQPNKVRLTGEEHELEVASAELQLSVTDQVTAVSAAAALAPHTSQTFGLTLTLK